MYSFYYSYNWYTSRISLYRRRETSYSLNCKLKQMSQFTEFTSVQLPTINNPLYILSEDLIYERYSKWSWLYIVVPIGTETNFASLPWICTLFWCKDDPRWIKASILHDYLWSKTKTIQDYQLANDIFYEAMIVEWTPRWIATIFYLAVSFSKYLYFILK